nr:hypothetical protein [Angustibacter aerolatus]
MPLVGAVVVAALPAASARLAARGAGVLAGAAGADHRDGAAVRERLRPAVPVHRACTTGSRRSASPTRSASTASRSRWSPCRPS